MSTKTKKAAASQGETAAKGKAKAQKLANVIETVVNKEQRFIFAFQLNADKLSPQKAKQHRQKLRRQLDAFDAKIRLEKNQEIKEQAIKEFKAFYKKEFILNDFTVKSLTDSRDEYKTKSLEDMLKIVRAHK